MLSYNSDLQCGGKSWQTVACCQSGPCQERSTTLEIRLCLIPMCRPAAGGCDTSETCDGVTPTCPDDEVRPDTFVCRWENRANHVGPISYVIEAYHVRHGLSEQI
jgi:hypothetical protein